MDYVTQQHKLYIAIASSHAFSLIAKWLSGKYYKVTGDLEKGNTDELPEVYKLIFGTYFNNKKISLLQLE